ncbi:MAG: hypothetical protein Q9186_005765 [Xanthomendoza sp. 1 TL-2023]
MFFNLASFALLTVTPVLATTSVSVATPTIPPGVTSAQAISSVFATASTSPDLGNPGNLSTFPLCAQICNNETFTTGLASGDFTDLRVLCGPEIRGLTSGCQAATCDPAEQNRTNILAQQVCGSIYNANPALSSQASVAIASATALAVAATKGKDPQDVSNFPQCAGIEFNAAVDPCQRANCNREDLLATLFLAEVLCERVGGILTKPINYTDAVNNGTIINGTNATFGSPSPAPFTGGGIQVGGNSVGTLIVTGFAVVVGMMMM